MRLVRVASAESELEGSTTFLCRKNQCQVVTKGGRERNPRRWSCNTRDWSPIDTVTLNPEREIAVPTGIKPGAENQR